MALQDLTPQLRTRLSRVERAVGWFVLLATLLLVFGFGYYISVMAERKGWFIPKINYQTCVQSAAGLKVGDPVKMIGYDVGWITRIVPNRPYEYYNITVYFSIKTPFVGYLWSDSTVKVAPSDFLGNRVLEVTKGIQGVPTILETNRTPELKIPVGILRRDFLVQARDTMLKTNADSESVMQDLNRMAASQPELVYTNLTKNSICWLDPAESPALTERLENVITGVEKALPNFLQLTNSLARVLTNAGNAAAHAEDVLLSFRPVASNLVAITENLRDPHGSLGEWLIPTNLNRQLTGTLAAATTTLDSAQTNLNDISSNLLISLENLAGITSNLNAQVRANTNMLSSISDAVIHTDELVQGLKRHWLLRSAFKSKATNQPSLSAPKQR